MGAVDVALVCCRSNAGAGPGDAQPDWRLRSGGSDLRATERSPTTSADGAWALSSSDDNRPGHTGVEAAVVPVGAGPLEVQRPRLVLRQQVRVGPVGAVEGDGVGRQVGIGPGDIGADGDGQYRWAEGEAGDVDTGGLIGRRREASRRRRRRWPGRPRPARPGGPRRRSNVAGQLFEGAARWLDIFMAYDRWRRTIRSPTCR